MLGTSSNKPDWEHARQILGNELGVQDIAALEELPDMLDRIARGVEQSKAKDDERGSRIIDDYEQAHVPAAEDPFVLQVKQETTQLQRDIKGIMEHLVGRRHLKGTGQQRVTV